MYDNKEFFKRLLLDLKFVRAFCPQHNEVGKNLGFFETRYEEAKESISHNVAAVVVKQRHNEIRHSTIHEITCLLGTQH